MQGLTSCCFLAIVRFNNEFTKITGVNRLATAKPFQQTKTLHPMGWLALVLLVSCTTTAHAGEWGGWRNYLAQELTPEYARAEVVSSTPVNNHWTHQASEALLPDFADELLSDEPRPSTHLTLSRERSTSSFFSTPQQQRQGGTGLLRERSLQREFISPGVTQQLDDGTFLNMSLILASQQYGAANLGYVASSNLSRGSYYGQGYVGGQGFLGADSYTPYQETVHGTGLRLGVETSVLPWLALTANYQSRIDMEDFSSLQGVYADAADLDIPARISAGFNVSLFDNFQLVATTERVMYSSINAFPSSLLPQRFLSLLGDSTSPEFNWSDLTVYRFGWDWRVHERVRLNFSYATRSQPLPSSNVLSEALREDLARNSFFLGLDSDLGHFGSLSLNAAFAPAEYAFGGNVLGVVTSDLDKSVEVEMRWRLNYY